MKVELRRWDRMIEKASRRGNIVNTSRLSNVTFVIFETRRMRSLSRRALDHHMLLGDNGGIFDCFFSSF